MADALRVVEQFSDSNSVKELAIDYVLYGTLAEIFGRERPASTRGWAAPCTPSSRRSA